MAASPLAVAAGAVETGSLAFLTGAGADKMAEKLILGAADDDPLTAVELEDPLTDPSIDSEAVKAGLDTPVVLCEPDRAGKSAPLGTRCVGPFLARLVALLPLACLRGADGCPALD